MDPTTAMSVEGQRCLCVVVLLIHTVTGAGEGPSSSIPTSSSSSVKPDQNELTVTFPPLDDLYSNTPEKHFGTENNTVVTSQTGSTALLPCVIRNIGDGICKSVQLWVRRYAETGDIENCQAGPKPKANSSARHYDIIARHKVDPFFNAHYSNGTRCLHANNKEAPAFWFNVQEATQKDITAHNAPGTAIKFCQKLYKF